jgi:hypothetical protein
MKRVFLVLSLCGPGSPFVPGQDYVGRPTCGPGSRSPGCVDHR